jgi:hypothetical protein
MSATAAPTAATPFPRAVSAQTRLLLPFLFERRAADRAAQALESASAGIARGLWTREPPRKLYRYRLEMTGQLDRFLFSHGEKGTVEGAYLHASGERIRRWLGAVDVELGSRVARVGVAPTPGVELFLTAHGAGVLSLCFDLGGGVDLESILELNRRLSILTRPGERAPWLSAPSPDGALPVADGGEPGTDAVPLADRLGRPGARFSMAELLAQLLEPLRGMGVAPIQESLCAYSVVALPHDVEVGAPETRLWTGPFLASLAQVHSGFVRAPERGKLGVPNLFTGPDHWAAASLQGAGHVLRARDGLAPTEDTVAEARDRYFVPYLTALLQRCAIKKAAEEATEMVLGEDVKHGPVSRLRSDVLAFALAGALPEVSVRYSLHRSDRMCQRAVDLTRNLGQVRSALGDLEAQLSARQGMEIAEAQRDLALQAAEQEEASQRIHDALVWIEVFIVVAYAAELVKFFVIELPHIHDPALRWGAALLAVGSGIAALAILRPWDHKHEPRGKHPRHAGNPGQDAVEGPAH